MSPTKRERPGANGAATGITTIGQSLDHRRAGVNPALAAAIEEASKAFARLLTIAVQPTAPTVDEDAPSPLADVAADLDVTIGWLRARIYDGQIPATRGPRQRAYVRRSDARRVLDSAPIEPRHPKKVIDVDDPIERKIASGELVRGAR